MQELTPIQPAEIDPKRRYLCRHIFTEGHRCGSPALRGQSLCYNHSRSRREAGIAGKSGTFPMPRIDDRASIQLALFEVLSRLAGGDIEYKRGSILLYGLQIASSNLPRHARTDAELQPQVEEITSDYSLGDLAPITEIIAPASLTPAQESVDQVVILSAAKNPRIQPEAPPVYEDAQPLEAYTRQSAHSANRSIKIAAATDRLILAAVQAVGTQSSHRPLRNFHSSPNASAISLETRPTHHTDPRSIRGQNRGRQDGRLCPDCQLKALKLTARGSSLSHFEIFKRIALPYHLAPWYPVARPQEYRSSR